MTHTRLLSLGGIFTKRLNFKKIKQSNCVWVWMSYNGPVACMIVDHITARTEANTLSVLLSYNRAISIMWQGDCTTTRCKYTVVSSSHGDNIVYKSMLITCHVAKFDLQLAVLSLTYSGVKPKQFRRYVRPTDGHPGHNWSPYDYNTTQDQLTLIGQW